MSWQQWLGSAIALLVGLYVFNIMLRMTFDAYFEARKEYEKEVGICRRRFVVPDSEKDSTNETNSTKKEEELDT